MSTKNAIASLVALVWGAAVLIAAVAGADGGVHGGSSFSAGHTVGVVFGGLLFLAGARGLVIELGRRRRS
jgi:hypothetical protein